MSFNGKLLCTLVIAIMFFGASCTGTSAPQAAEDPLAKLVLDRLVDGVSVQEDDAGQQARITVRGRILIGGRSRYLPPGVILRRESELILRVNGQVKERKLLAPFKPIGGDEVCCWGLPPDCSEDNCKKACAGHLGSCLCICDDGGTTGGDGVDPASSDYTADLGPVALRRGDHIHVSIVAASGATPELFTLNDSQWVAIGRYGAGAGGQCGR